MILYRWQGAATNFGDELNTILWPRLLPEFFDQEQHTRFLGIGSVMDRRHPTELRKVVAGSGYGGYERKPALDQNWIIHWVRGPHTAATLGLPLGLGLGDPAALLPRLLDLRRVEGGGTGFMPHFESAARGAWRQAAEWAGVTLIDPRGSPMAILDAIRRCDCLVSEALHGVIAADALRVPWIAVRPMARIHRSKWFDWAATVGVRLRFQTLPASTLTEWACNSRLGSWHHSQQLLGRYEARLRKLSWDGFAGRAAEALAAAAGAVPQLSAETALERTQARMMDAVAMLSANPLRGACQTAPVRSWRSDLQMSDDSAYQPT